MTRTVQTIRELAKNPFVDMVTVTKKDLIDRISETTKQKRVDVKEVIQGFLDQVVAELGRGNRLEFRDFGVFEIKRRASRVAQNPKTMEPVHVPARKTVRFKVGREMRRQLDQASGGNGVVVRARGKRREKARAGR